VTQSTAVKLDVLVGDGGDSVAPEVLLAIEEVRVELALGVTNRLTLRIADPQLKLIDGSPIDVGDPIEVKLSAPGASSTTSVFKGEVVSIEGDIGLLGAHVSIVAFDRSHRMRRDLKTNAFPNTTVSDVASTIASSAGLQLGQCEADGGTRKDILQHGESDWALLQRLCDEADCDIAIVGKTLDLLKRKASGSADVTLTIGETLRAFRPRFSGVAQIETVHVRSWNPDGKEPIDGQATPQAPVGEQSKLQSTAASALGNGTMTIVDHPVESSTLANAAAQSAANRLASTVVEATGIAVGTPGLLPGDVVKLAGVGKRFSGEHRIAAVTHVYRGASGYETRFTLGAGGKPLVEEFGGRPLKNRFASQLAVGVVTNNDDSSDGGQGRVKVKYPALDNKTESVWARIAWPAAGKERGILAIPEVDDEVIIGFEGGDIERPFVLGTLFNGQDGPASDHTDNSGTKPSYAMVFPRDVVIKTDGKSKTTAKDDITIDSTQGAITIQADQKGLTLQGQQAVQISSQTATTQLQGAQGTTIKDDMSVTISCDGTSVSISCSAGSISISGGSISISGNESVSISGPSVMLG
jgi:uncharacterized protein involved in type VI secretion and phage assembly